MNERSRCITGFFRSLSFIRPQKVAIPLKVKQAGIFPVCCRRASVDVAVLVQVAWAGEKSSVWQDGDYYGLAGVGTRLPEARSRAAGRLNYAFPGNAGGAGKGGARTKILLVIK